MLKGRTYLAIGLLVVVGGFTVWKVTRTSPYEHRTNVAAASPLPALKKDDIDEIEIAEAGKPAVVLAKDGAEWKVKAPVADRADQKAVEQAVDALTTLTLRDVIAEKQESWEKVGLKESDTAKITPKKGGKAIVTLQVGKTGNVRVGDAAAVWSTNGMKRYALVKDVKMWRDRSILAFAQEKIDTIEVDYGGTKVAVKREQPPAPPASPDAGPPPPPAPARWVLTSDKDRVGGALDESQALNLAASLGRLEASDFPTDTTKAELDKPRMTVTVTLTDKTQKQLLVGADEGQDTYVKLAGGDRVWKIHKYEADRIPPSPANWRDKTLARIPRADVTKVELAKGADKVLLERVDDKSFRAVVPADLGELDQSRVNAVLGTFEVLRANRILDRPDPKAFAAPVVVVTVTKKDGKTLKLTVGKKDDKLPEYPVAVGGDKDVYAIAEYVVANYLKAPTEFKKKSGS